MKCSLGISNFLEEISILSHSVVFLCFFALITEEGFLISSCYSLELCIQMLISFLSPLLLASLLFTAGEGRCTQLCLCEETSETPQRRGLVLRASGLVSMWSAARVGPREGVQGPLLPTRLALCISSI